MKDERLCDVTPVRFTDAERDDDKEEDEDNDADGCPEWIDEEHHDQTTHDPKKRCVPWEVREGRPGEGGMGKKKQNSQHQGTFWNDGSSVGFVFRTGLGSRFALV